MLKMISCPLISMSVHLSHSLAIIPLFISQRQWRTNADMHFRISGPLQHISAEVLFAQLLTEYDTGKALRYMDIMVALKKEITLLHHLGHLSLLNDLEQTKRNDPTSYPFHTAPPHPHPTSLPERVWTTVSSVHPSLCFHPSSCFLLYSHSPACFLILISALAFRDHQA